MTASEYTSMEWRLGGLDAIVQGDTLVVATRRVEHAGIREIFSNRINIAHADPALLGWDPTLSPIRSPQNLPGLDIYLRTHSPSWPSLPATTSSHATPLGSRRTPPPSVPLDGPTDLSALGPLGARWARLDDHTPCAPAVPTHTSEMCFGSPSLPQQAAYVERCFDSGAASTAAAAATAAAAGATAAAAAAAGAVAAPLARPQPPALAPPRPPRPLPTPPS